LKTPRLLKILAVTALLAAMGPPTSVAQLAISFGNSTAGANHFTWFEAEAATDLGTWGFGISGSQSGGMWIGQYGPVSDVTISTVSIPAAMANGILYAYTQSFADRDYPVVVGLSSGNLSVNGTSSTNNRPVFWTNAVDLGSVAAGSQNFTLTGGDIYNIVGFDGFYISDSAISTFGGLDADGWRTAPTFSVLNEVAPGFTPVITISGHTSAAILLNGNPYTSGTPITAPGNYTLTVEAFNGSTSRILSGASFAIIPEPFTGLLLSLSSVLLFLRRCRQKFGGAG